jgi:hypothetical protein
MQVADIKTGQIVSAIIPQHQPPGSMHGIGWTPDETEVWENGGFGEVYVWDMLDPMAPKLKEQLSLRNKKRLADLRPKRGLRLHCAGKK